MLDDRDLDLAVELADIGMALDRRRGRAVAGEVSGLELDVRAVGQRILDVVDTDVDPDPVVGPRRLESVVGTGQGDVAFVPSTVSPECRYEVNVDFGTRLTANKVDATCANCELLRGLQHYLRG